MLQLAGLKRNVNQQRNMAAFLSRQSNLPLPSLKLSLFLTTGLSCWVSTFSIQHRCKALLLTPQPKTICMGLVAFVVEQKDLCRRSLYQFERNLFFGQGDCLMNEVMQLEYEHLEAAFHRGDGAAF